MKEAITRRDNGEGPAPSSGEGTAAGSARLL